MVKTAYPKAILAVLILISASMLAASLQPPALAEVGKKEPGTKASHELYQSFSAEEKRWIEDNPVVVARVGNAPPLHFFEGTFKGISVDYLNTIASHAGFQVRYVTGIPWPKALNYLKNHDKIDILLTAKITAERRKYMAFTENYLFMPLVIFSRIDADFISRMEDLRHRTISIESGYDLSDYLVKHYPGIDLFETNTSEEALKAVASGKTDAYIGNLTIGSYIIQQNNLNNVKVAAPTPLEDHNQAMAIRDDWPELAGIIDKTLAFMTPDEHAAIRNKWLSIRYEYGIDKVYVLKWILSVAGLAFLIIGFILIWNKRLKTEVVLRRKSEDAFKQNEYRYKSAQRMGKVGNWEYDLVTETFWGSDQAKQIYGFDPDSKQFTTDEVENCIPERERVHQALIDLIEKGKPYNLEFEIHPVSGSKMRTIRSNAEIIKDDFGAPLKVLGVIQDITDQKRAGQEKAKLKLELMQAQKMESIGTLAGGIAHDFNNILSSIIGFTELALEEAEKNSPIEESLREVYAAGNRAKELVKQILAFARKTEEETKPIKLEAIAEEITLLLRASIPTSIEIITKFDSHGLIMGNPTQMHQIVMNLCTNAAHAMEERGGKLTISTKDVDSDQTPMTGRLKTPDQRYVQFKVSDTGTGIPPEIMDSIFEPYFTTKKTGEGTGMGLAMVQGIVESYGGQITAESTLGEGSTFTIYLPLTNQSATQREHEPEALPTGTERILVVDDEAPIAKMSSLMLEGLGYQVTARFSSTDALELFKARPTDFDLVISDMTMPDMSGDVLAIEMMRIRPDIPVILCTGYSKRISEESAYDIGSRALVNKPYQKADLARTVRKVLDENHAS